jgi:hypothetical protein
MKLDKDAVRVYLEDHGQDFTRFTLRNRIIEDADMQGTIWNGRHVANPDLKPGDLIEFADGTTFNYPVQTLSFVTLDEAPE